MIKIVSIAFLCLALMVCETTYAKTLEKDFIEKQVLLAAFKQEVNPTALVSFAQTLLGIPYKYGGSNPKLGFDCSGFVNYVFKNFHFPVPRSSSAFSKHGERIVLEKASPGDLILFRGTNPKVKSVGHIGIIISNAGEPIRFIHASSGKAQCVTETPLDARYQKRFIKVIRLL
ncbi:C40 family peptidase [Olivibacter domesticus]|uniref:NlpC/P60 family protein n=1 Tax=Olivibacter domesticus TaxID=407022 RepID=A0A1H7QI60_OLID1|nr:C40 family peptidase [Olivibacter domesticus]SEL47781.1 NlpC/P60 family protein [Olivibacter domesticus]